MWWGPMSGMSCSWAIHGSAICWGRWIGRRFRRWRGIWCGWGRRSTRMRLTSVLPGSRGERMVISKWASWVGLGTLLLVAQLRADDNPEWTTPIAPFRIAGNLYYVGSRD